MSYCAQFKAPLQKATGKLHLITYYDIILFMSTAGCFVTGLEYSADVKAEVVGKPEEKFFRSALDRLNALNNTNIKPEG